MKNIAVKILLLSMGGLLFAGCNKDTEDTGGGSNVNPNPQACPEGTHIDSNKDNVCDVCGFPVDKKSANTISADPSAPFYLKVGQTKTIKAKLSPTPEHDEEKTFTWKNPKPTIAKVTPQSESKNADILGLKEGEVKITAVNDYAPEFEVDFHANVIDFDEDNMYLWEFDSSRDKPQFGYENVDGKKAGTTDGTASLGNLDWVYHRSAANSLQSSKGAVGFGKNTMPETLITLNAHNERPIKKIVIETASKDSLANITVKVGDNDVINRKTPSYSDDFIGSVSYRDSSTEPKKYNGDISIRFDTPEFNAVEAEENPNYREPGAVYLKSIWIEYYEIELDWKTNISYDLQAEFLNNKDTEFEDGIFKGLIGTAKPISYTDEENGITINFEKVKKPSSSDKIKDYALTNGYVEIVCNKPDEVLKTVRLNYLNGSNKTTFTEYFSVLGGEPYLEANLLDSANEGIVGSFIKSDNVNAVRFVPKGNNVGLISIEVKTIAGEQYVIDKIELEEGGILNKTSYKQGETFDPAGLKNVVVSFTNTEADPVLIPANTITWFDGPSYTDSIDHLGSTEILQEGTTYVVGYYHGFTLTVEDIEVVLVKMNFSLVKDASEINTTDRYLITSSTNNSICLGSTTATGGFAAQSGFTLEDEIEICDSYENDLFKFEKDELSERFAIANFDGSHRFTITASGSASAAGTSKDGCQLFTISIDEETGNATVMMEFEINDKDSGGLVKKTFFLATNSTGTTFTTRAYTDKLDTDSIRIYKLTSIVDPRIVTE